MNYEELLITADRQKIMVKEKFLLNSDGLIKGNRIAIRQGIPTTMKKADVLAEELGHYHTTVGRIVEQDSDNARKQEHAARLWAFNVRIPLPDIVKAYRAHCKNTFEISEYLDVSEDTLQEALEFYRQKYGNGTSVGDVYVCFEPYLTIKQLL